MSPYSKYLICYDVADNKTRKKLFDGLKDLGLKDIQRSVFYGDMKPAEFRAMKQMVSSLLDKDSDRCLWVQCTLSEEAVRQCFGYGQFKWVEPDSHDSI